MASTLTSRKLHHVCQYLMKEQIALVESMTCGKDWDKIKQGFLDLNHAIQIVLKIRDEELGWSE